MANVVLELEKASKFYWLGEARVKALDDVSLRVKRGEFVAITGSSGAGKSTLLHLIGLLDKPSSGRVLLDGVNASRLPDDDLAVLRGLKIGFVFQFFNLHPTLTALENVELPMVIAGVDERERRVRARELLALVNLSHRARHFPAQLSGGERQRVAIARALANNPAILLADEPTGNLDSKTGAEIMGVFAKLNKQGRTIVMVTHEKNVARHAKRVVELRDGKMLRDSRV